MLNKIREEYIANASMLKEHGDNLAVPMAESIILSVAEDLSLFRKNATSTIEFAAYLREHDLSEKSNMSTWSGTLATRPEITVKSKSLDGRGTISLVSRQFYKAHHKLDPDSDYNGYFEVEVVTYKTSASDKKLEDLLDPVAKIVCRLIHEHYREQICKYYPEWDTEYINTVNYLLRSDNS